MIILSTSRRVVALVLFVSLLATACGGGSDDPTSAPEIDLTQPLPTATTEAEAAPTPTAAPEPTETTEPTATPAPASSADAVFGGRSES